MKANKKFRLVDDNAAYAKIVGGLVALLVTIIVAIMVYWSITTSIAPDTSTVETFTGYTATSNASAWNVKVNLEPASDALTNVTCYNSTGESESYPTFTRATTRIDVAADAASEFDQVNVTYTSRYTNNVNDNVNPTASTVLNLLPVLAIVIVGSILIGIVFTFAGGKKGGI